MNIKHPKISVIIPAAGAGKRMKHELPKILIPLKGKTILEHTICGFFNVNILEMIIPVSEAIRPDVEELCEKLNAPFPIRVISGGEQRQDSIWNALKDLDKETTVVAVHDAARPFFDPELIDKATPLLEKYDGAIAAVPATYTMKQIKNELVEQTLPRDTLWQINTPQVFNKDVLIAAYEKAYADKFYGTDDAMLLERMGKKITVIPDVSHNIKITSPSDLYSAERIMSKDKGVFMQRIGQGYDVHRLVKGRKLILGGVDIPHKKGLDGHSDADVLVHAIMDAILGAAAMGDIGKHFPDTDAQYKNIDSMFLLYGIRKLMEVNSYAIQNIDATLILQVPKVAPYIDDMRKNIADKLGLELTQVSVKATTEEGLGFTGREEGVAATAIVMLNEI
jgi:2-C-methyl-D-erythritol 4-phosphate cytidylyltransferase/2-C-methyl-D-erythritol 2,4-cyclodiphosphate synthase